MQEPPVPGATGPVTIIFRAHPGAARAGRIAGLVEVVDSGESVPIRSAEKLLTLLSALASASSDDPEPEALESQP
jgi:hypothetical protein